MVRRAYSKEPLTEEQRQLAAAYVPLARREGLFFDAVLPRGHVKEDMVSFALYGLVDAARKFEPARGLKFATYAKRRIRGAVFDAVRELDIVPKSARAQENPENLPQVFSAADCPLKDGPDGQDEHDRTILDVLPDHREKNEPSADDFWALVEEELGPRDAAILRERFEMGATLAAKHGIVECRACQIVNRALPKLAQNEKLRRLAEEIGLHPAPSAD